MMGRKMGRKRCRPTASAPSTSTDPLSLTRLTISRMAATSDLTGDNNDTLHIQPSETICADPTHYHSFQSASTIFSFAAVRSCGMCGGRLGSLFGGGGGTDSGAGSANNASTGDAATGGKLVKCLACGMYAHRRCAFRNYSVHCALLQKKALADAEGNDMKINLPVCCTVNKPLIEKLDSKLLGLSNVGDSADDDDDEGVDASSCASDTSIEKKDEVDDDGDLVEMDTMHDNHVGSSNSEAAEDSESVVEVEAGADTEAANESTAADQAPSFLSRIGWGSRQSSSIGELDLDGPGDRHVDREDSGIIIESNGIHTTNESTSEDGEAVWTEAGPPCHWAANEKAEDKLCGLPSSKGCTDTPKEDTEERDGSRNNDSSASNDDGVRGDDSDETQSDEAATQDEDAPIVPSAQPFTSVARALHEVVLPLFLGKQQPEQPVVGTGEAEKESAETMAQGGGDEAREKVSGGESQAGDDDDVDDNNIASKPEEASPGAQGDTTIEPAPSNEEVAGILTELDPKAPPPPPPLPPSTFATTLEVVRTTRRTRSNMGVASVAGSIVGGVAGLALAGPAGAVILSKVCQTAGVLSVLLDGTMSIGVLVAGAAAAKFAAEQVAQGGNRMLALGGGTKGSRAVMLVRPNVVVDPVWGDLTDEAKRSHPKILASSKRSVTSGGFLAHHQAKVADKAKQRRNEVDADIVRSDEYEIATEDKVVLIVLRSLNDRLSLPGHVYSKLVQEHKNRAVKRKNEEENEKDDRTKEGADETRKDEASDDLSEDGEPRFSRGRRQDAHGVIKHVTATLLEVRPGLGATTRLTELTASAVEGLVFGELYDSVFEEICDETAGKDNALMTKMYEFEMDHQSKRKICMEISDGEQYGDCQQFPISDENISVAALEALLSLPEAKSPVDKLDYCVQFLEAISVHFDNAAGFSRAVSADYLLKLVCEHIIVAKVKRLNAELAFLEEFARDEHLLRGKEGYSLVTLQASLHFLNASTDFDTDIFKNEY